ncbi:hypothetical protein [Absidia glauca]|uniref:MULE transposase domain-containing protein n=1 Tax=Absidia glauca TaxID=4829 RepID=A0A168TBU7_ABSGL|nr:hypothetical protein [Absidia glauca]
MLNNGSEVKFAFIKRITPSYAAERYLWFDNDVKTHGNFVLNKTHSSDKNSAAPYQVDNEKNWTSISALLCLNDDDMDTLESEIEEGRRFPKMMAVNYRAVQNLVLSRISRVSKKHSVGKTSVGRWMEYMANEKGCTTLFNLHPDGGPILVSCFSPWQKKAEEWCIDSTHKMCFSFVDQASCYFYTNVVVNPVTRRGVPVCFFKTNKEVIPVLTQWLNWIKNNTNDSVKRFMIDCSATEIAGPPIPILRNTQAHPGREKQYAHSLGLDTDPAAIRQVFGSDANVLLCHWHVKLAWDDKLSTTVKVPNATDATKLLRGSMRGAMTEMMYSTAEGDFNNLWAFFVDTFNDQSAFITYFANQWTPKKHLWVKAHDTQKYAVSCHQAAPIRAECDASFHTNNFIKSYHHVLKGKYLGKSRNLRVDRLVYILATQLTSDYRWDTVKVTYGAAPATLRRHEEETKKMVDRMDPGAARCMVSNLDASTFDL